MSSTAQDSAAGREPLRPRDTGRPEIVRVTVSARSFASELRAIRIVWKRELIRFRADRLRMVTSLVQPLLFLFVLGAGLQTLSAAGTHGVALETFIYPGILVGLARAGAARGRGDRHARADHARRGDLGVQHHRVAAGRRAGHARVDDRPGRLAACTP